jgi:hypothetical protein
MRDSDLVPNPRMKRIQKISRVFRLLCAIALVVSSVLAVIILFGPTSEDSTAGFHFGKPESPAAKESAGKSADEVNAEPKPITVRFAVRFGEDSNREPAIVEKVKPEFRWINRPLLFGITLFWMAGIAVLYRLFHFYERGIIFAAENARCIKWIGMWIMAAWALSNAIEISKLVTHESADIDLRIDEMLLAGLLVLLISWIMEEGGKIQQEHELTI